MRRSFHFLWIWTESEAVSETGFKHIEINVVKTKMSL